jgi:hypothetical protein
LVLNANGFGSHSQNLVQRMRIPEQIYTLHSPGTWAMWGSNPNSLLTFNIK